ncbi:MAG: hypothetical protein AABX80_01805 [Nanoarchaeota archaeon]
MNKFISILFGLILLAVGVYGAFGLLSWGEAALSFLKGGIVWLVLLIGLILVILGISDLKN